MLLAIPGLWTVAIVMLEFFQELPGQPPMRTRRMRDITRFYDIFSQGQYVIENCVRYGRAPSPGWINAGKEPARPKRFQKPLLTSSVAIYTGPRRGIGIFIWTTGSVINNIVSGGPYYNVIFEEAAALNTTLGGWNLTGSDTA